MRHRKSGVKLNRTTSHRQAMFRNMVTSLLKYDRIRTTDAKAKELRRWADHIITLAKRGDLHALRQALSIVREKDVVYKVFQSAKDRFGDIQGGYTRIYKIGRRPGDTAPMTLIELANPESNKPSVVKKSTKSESSAIKQAPSAATPVAADSVSAEPESVDGGTEPLEENTSSMEAGSASAVESSGPSDTEDDPRPLGETEKQEK